MGPLVMARMSEPTEATRPFMAPRWPVRSELTRIVIDGKEELPPMPRTIPIRTSPHHSAARASRTYLGGHLGGAYGEVRTCSRERSG